MNAQTTILTIALAAICTTGYAANNNLTVTDSAQTEEVLTFAQEKPIDSNPADSCTIVLFNQETYAWDTIWVKHNEFELPEYPGGRLLTYIASHTKYPRQAKRLKITGCVFVGFMVNDKGDIEDVHIARGVHPLLDAEAIRVVQSIPKKFKPGIYQGTPVKVPFTLPLNFDYGTPPASNYTSNDSNLADTSLILSYNPKTNAWDTVYSNVDKMPEYPGGELKMIMDIAMNLRYPSEAIKKKIEGRVLVQFVIDERGETRDVRVINSPNPILNDEAIRVVKSLPKNFKPGIIRGNPAKVRYTIPINFRIN
jgi:TonB family protein